jgi:peptidoglycan hydrolase CwlO-like protein
MSKISVKKACELAGISKPTFYKYINKGLLSVVKDSKGTFVDMSELLRVFPESKVLNESKDTVKILPDLTQELTHKDELIHMLRQQLNDKQKDNDFLKEQLTQVNQNFTQLNKFLEDKTTTEIPKKRRKIFGIF